MGNMVKEIEEKARQLSTYEREELAKKTKTVRRA